MKLPTLKNSTIPEYHIENLHINNISLFKQFFLEIFLMLNEFLNIYPPASVAHKSKKSTLLHNSKSVFFNSLNWFFLSIICEVMLILFRVEIECFGFKSYQKNISFEWYGLIFFCNFSPSFSRFLQSKIRIESCIDSQTIQS